MRIQGAFTSIFYRRFNVGGLRSQPHDSHRSIMFETKSLTVDAVLLILHNPNLLSPWKLDNATVFYTTEYLKLETGSTK